MSIVQPGKSEACEIPLNNDKDKPQAKGEPSDARRYPEDLAAQALLTLTR